VDKFIGDGLMAFFGDPADQPDHATMAVRAAMKMQEVLSALRARSAAEAPLGSEAFTGFHIRIGINTGEVVVGDLGSPRIMAYTAIGANVNLASRLEGKAPVDGILVSGSVHQAVREAIPMRFSGRTTAKGIESEFDTWEVLCTQKQSDS